MISVRRTWPSRCTWATSAPRSSATASRARCGCSATASSPTTTSATGARSSASCCVGWKRHLDRAALAARSHRRTGTALQSHQRRERSRSRHVLEEATAGTGQTPGRRRGKPAIWREMIALSQKQFDTIYARLGVKFDHTLGESFYNPRLEAVVDDLLANGHRARKRRRDCHFLRRQSSIEGASRARPQKRRRVQLHHHRPGHAGIPAGNLAAGRNHLCHGRPPATAFPAIVRRLSPLASGRSRKIEAGPRLVRLDSGRGRQAVQDALRRHGEAGRFARRSRGAGLQDRFRKKSRSCRRRSGGKSPGSSASAR